MNLRHVVAALAVALGLVPAPGSLAAQTLDGPQASVLVAPAGIYDFTNHGTAWVPEIRGKFSVFKPRGAGMVTKVKAPGRVRVHIPVPYPSRVADSAVNITYVEFCAQSSNGGRSFPVQIDLHAYGGKFYSGPIFWPATVAAHCFGVAFNPSTWQQDLGASLVLMFGSARDTITLYKAWVRVAP